MDLRALTVLTKAKFEEAEAKFVAEHPGNDHQSNLDCMTLPLVKRLLSDFF